MSYYLIPIFLSALCAFLNELRIVRLTRGAYGIVLLALALFAGLRHEVGHDWPAYKEYFENLDYFESRFEIGFYLLNYFIKSLGGSYSVVFLTASALLSFSLYRLTSRRRLDHFYFLTIFIGYSFLILNFAQVRQSIAISFILFSVDSYLRNRNRLRAFFIAAIAPFFHFSAVLYLIMLLVAWTWESLPKFGKAERMLFLLSGVSIFIGISFADPYSLLSALAFSTRVQEKIEIYSSINQSGTALLWLFATYLAVVTWYIFKYQNNFVAKLAVISLSVSILMIAIFPGNYVMYSRAYVIACIFQATAMAFIFANHNGFIHKLFFMVSILVSLVYYARALIINSEAFIPYTSIFL